jgi:ABC-type transport system involved in multi-copper enzyme maturation permease subunit
MLWYKAWIESRVRFLLAATVTLAMCAATVLGHDAIQAYLAGHDGAAENYVSYIYRLWYRGAARTLFMLFAVILGMGGLVRERELGTAVFTLALPVSRVRLMLVRAATGLFEVVALATIPAIVAIALSPIAHHSYPAAQAIEFALLWSAGGAALFSVAFLASAVLTGEYTSFVIAEVVLFVVTVSIQFMRLARPATRPYLYTVQEIMSGFHMDYFDPQTHLLVGPLPAKPLLLLAVLTCVFVGCSLRYTARKDF